MGLFDLLTGATPGGAGAEVAKATVSSIFTGVDELIQDFKLPPEKMVEWQEFKLKAANDMATSIMTDRQSARQREAQVKDWTPSLLAWTVIGVFASAQYFVFTQTLPAGSETMVSRVLGTLDMALGMILGYYFGSSATTQQHVEALHASISDKKDSSPSPAVVSPPSP